jgi:hypothetical protein
MLLSQEPIYAFLNLELRVIKSTSHFQEALGIPSLDSRRLQEVVLPSEVEKVNRIQTIFQNESRQRDPAYLPPIYSKPEDDRTIHTMGFIQDELKRIPLTTQEIFTFLGADSRHRSHHIRMGLGKRGSTYFIAATILQPPPLSTPFQQQYTPTTNFSRDPLSRDQQYGYQNPNYAHQSTTPNFSPNLQNFAYQQPGSMSNIPQVLPYGFPQQQPNYNGVAQHYPGLNPSPVQSFSTSNNVQQHSARPLNHLQASGMEARSGQGQQQKDLQLPPIRDSTADSFGESRNKDDRSGRVDIGGLIDNSNAVR